MTKAQALSTLKTQHYGMVRTGEYEIGEYGMGEYGHQAILERVASVAT